MSFSVNYAAMYPKEWERRAKALEDLKSWLGDDYEKLCKSILDERDKGTERVAVVSSLAIFVGVQGLPVTVWLDFLGYPKDVEPDTKNPRPAGVSASN